MRGAERALGAALIALVAGIAACSSGTAAPPCGRRADHAVVACWNGQPVTATEVSEHLGAVEREPVVGLPGSRRHGALMAAIRVRALAAEAARRKLAAGDVREARGRAVLYQALVRAEAERVGAVPERISLDEARRRYEARPGVFNKITAVWVRARYVRDPDTSAQLAAEAVAWTDEQFPDDLGEAHAEGVDPKVRRAANDLRAAGETVGPVRLADGRDVILRATKVEMAVRPFDDRIAREVQNHLARELEAAALHRLAQELVPRGRLETFDDELMRIPEPAATEPE